MTSTLSRSRSELDLLTGALLIAQDAYPGLDVGAHKRRLGLLSAPLAGRGLERAPLLMQAAALGEYLYDTCGFRGNREDYYDPRNSFVNEVIERRLGIPLTLAIIYIEVARRIGVRARGVGFPGHFLVRVEDSERGEAVIVDPFGAGAVLDRDDLQQLLKQGEGGRLELTLAMLSPTPTRHSGSQLMNCVHLHHPALIPAPAVPCRSLIDYTGLCQRVLDGASLGQDRRAAGRDRHLIVLGTLRTPATSPRQRLTSLERKADKLRSDPARWGARSRHVYSRRARRRAGTPRPTAPSPATFSTRSVWNVKLCEDRGTPAAAW